jgi:hypothetical protein
MDRSDPGIAKTTRDAAQALLDAALPPSPKGSAEPASRAVKS